MDYDFLFFISEKNSNIIKKKEKNRKKWINKIFRSCKSFNISRKHIEQISKIKFILDDEVDKFLLDKNIYFDTDCNKKQLFDILYIKVNDHFFINEDKYFDKITEYYFNLYCEVFSRLGLKNINLLTNSDVSEEIKYNGGLNLYAGNVSVNVEHKNKVINNKNFNRDFSNNSLFQKEVEKYSQLKDEEKNEYIYSYLPKNKYGESIMYRDSLKLGLVKQRIENLNLLSFDEKISFENNISNKVNANLSEFFTSLNIGLSISTENSSNTKNDFTLVFNFYDINQSEIKVTETEQLNTQVDETEVLEINIDIPKEPEEILELDVTIPKTPEIKVDEEKISEEIPKIQETENTIPKTPEIKVEILKQLLPVNIVRTHPSFLSGPWPSDCDEIEAFDCFEKDLERVTNEKILKDPKRNVIEIVTELFSYRVKVWRIKNNEKPNIIISNGNRFMKWDSSNVENFDEALNTLRRNGYY